LKTQGEIKAAVAQAMSRFEQEYMGRGPKDIHAFLIEDLLVNRLQGVLTAAEQQLVGTIPLAGQRLLVFIDRRQSDREPGKVQAPLRR
jgi:uncharacterized protein YbcI